MTNRFVDHVVADLKCTGCCACFNICPTRAITIGLNERGFYIPVISENKCIRCGACSSICNKNCERSELPAAESKCLIAFTKNKKLYKSGASAGVFSMIAYNFLKKGNSVVCGASFKDGKVKHIIIERTEDLPLLAGSKYVQSFVGDVFLEIRSLLQKGSRVLFSGTPCQVDALKSFLGNNYTDRFFTIDIICHGVPSPVFFEKDIEQYLPVESIKKISFRQKNRLFKSRSGFLLTIHGKKKITHLPNRDAYYSMFLKNLSFRDVCYDCKYANRNRPGDITIGDCDSYQRYPHFHGREATSVVMVNNRMGEILWKENDGYFDYAPIDIENECRVNTQLTHSAERPSAETINSLIIASLDLALLKKRYTKPAGFKERIGILRILYLP